jgi:hypothetical protein
VLFWSQALDSDPGYFDTRKAERLLWDTSIAEITAASPASARATSP